MAIVNFKDGLNSFRVSKRFSKPNGYGNNIYGYSFYGFSNVYAGIYQQRHGTNRKITVKEKFYSPTNPQTIPQQANRDVFSDAISGWQGLTSEQKLGYNKRAVGRHMSGYNLYIREYMLTH